MDRPADFDPAANLSEGDQLLFCLEELERLNILVSQLAQAGVVPQAVVAYAELKATARRAARAAKVEENLYVKPTLEATAQELDRRADQALTALQASGWGR